MSFDSVLPVEFYVRPDGRDAIGYKQIAADGRLRLAWEFLIRNEDFQIDCQAVSMGYVEPSFIAESWGLYKYKPWYEPFNAKRKPRFASSRVRMFIAKPKQRVRHIALAAGEVAFVLNVNKMVDSLDSQGAQLATLARYLENVISRRAKRQGVVPGKVSRANDVHLNACLQVADLLHANTPPAEIKRLVLYMKAVAPAKAEQKLKGQTAMADTNSVNGRFRDIKKRIDELIRGGGYLKLAARAHTPSTTNR